MIFSINQKSILLMVSVLLISGCLDYTPEEEINISASVYDLLDQNLTTLYLKVRVSNYNEFSHYNIQPLNMIAGTDFWNVKMNTSTLRAIIDHPDSYPGIKQIDAHSIEKKMEAFSVWEGMEEWASVVIFFEIPTQEQKDLVLSYTGCSKENLVKSNIIRSNCTYNYDEEQSPEALYLWLTSENAREVAELNFVKSIEGPLHYELIQ